MPVRSESEDNWQGFLFQLYERGLKGKRLKLIIIDGKTSGSDLYYTLTSLL
jgi:flavodoxin